MSDLASAEVLARYPQHDGTLYGLLVSRSVGGARPFLIFDDSVLEYAEARIRVDHLADRLHERGVGPGDRIAICAENHVRSILAVFALARLGAICVPVNPELGVEELAWILGHATVSGVLTVGALAARLLLACNGAGIAPWCALLDDDADPLWQRTETGSLPAAAGPDTTWVILYTSGTTGYPKGVMHSQRTFVLTGEVFVERMHLQPDDRMLCILPLFHINALLYSLGGALAAGATLVVERRFSASRFWRIAADTRASEVNIIAAVGHILARRPAQEFRPDHGIVKVYGAPIAADVAEVFRHRFGIATLIEGYGLTEAPAVCTQPFDGERRIGSMGRAARHPGWNGPFVQLRVVDEAGHDVSPGEPGELLVRSPVVMQGYYRDEAQTRDAFSGGWLRTGDIVRRDPDGCHTFVSRKKDIIRRRGENISVAEVERVIRLHPRVRDVAVIAVDSELGDDDMLAVVLPTDSGDIKEAEIAGWCRAKLAPHKTPRYVTFVSALPYTPSHRVAKHRLRADAALRARAIDLLQPLARQASRGDAEQAPPA